MRALIKAFIADRRGNVTMMAAIMLPLAVGGVGMAVSYSSASDVRTSMQAALDSAVLAGAGLPDASPASERIKTAQSHFHGNVKSFARASATEVNAAFAVDGTVVSGEAKAVVKNPFGGIVGLDTYPVAARAAATKDSTPICVLGLNGLDNGAFDINGGPKFNADCAVQANSNSRSGMSQEGKSATVKAKKFSVTGGQKTQTYVPPPAEGSPKVADPYASIPFPSHDLCDKGSKLLQIRDDTTLSPGTYCGGIHITGSNPRVTLQPGIYVMVDGPFWVNGGGTVTGDRVTIAFTGKGAALQIWGDATVKLTSPTSGAYANMQFFQDRTDTESRGLWASIGGNAGGPDGAPKLQIEGIAYFPTQNFWVFGNAGVTINSPGLALVADKIWTQGNATVNITHDNPRNLSVAAGPATSFGVRLIK